MDLVEEIRMRRALPAPGERRVIRKAAGVSANRMAAELGVHRGTVGRWEDGTQEPRGNVLEQYAQLLQRLAALAG